MHFTARMLPMLACYANFLWQTVCMVCLKTVTRVQYVKALKANSRLEKNKGRSFANVSITGVNTEVKDFFLTYIHRALWK